MTTLYRIILCVLLLTPTVLHADEVTNLLNNAITYQNSLSAQYDVTETFQNDITHTTMTKKYTVLKKGEDQLIQDENGAVRIRKGKKDKFLIQDRMVEYKAPSSNLEVFLAAYQAGQIKADVTSENNAIVLKGTRDNLNLKVEFSKEPLVVTSYETKNKQGKTVAEGSYTYDFSSEPAKLLKSIESGTVVENGKVISQYKKTLRYQNYSKNADVPDAAFNDEAVKNKNFPRR
jgi:hypothetical protein